MQECINFEIKITDKTCSFIHLYRSPSQSKDEFKLNLVSAAIKNPYLTVPLRDFNAQETMIPRR